MAVDDPFVAILAQPAPLSSFRLRDGRVVQLRPAVAEDAPQLAALCERLSAESSRLRFFRAGRKLTAQEALGIADIDRMSDEAIVALDGHSLSALGTLHQLGDEAQAEVTLLVEDAYQGRGLGRYLLEQMIAAARARHYRILLAEMLPDNDRVLRLLESAGLPSIADEYFGLLRVRLFMDWEFWPPA
jgi:GNAT superfamily N-acetyltransferase